jgi:hypothetical protein
MRQMMQSLPAARFKLTVHRETRELPVYAMVVNKNGPEFRFTEAIQGPVADFTLERAPDTDTADLPASAPIFTAIQEQPGLKPERGKARLRFS